MYTYTHTRLLQSEEAEDSLFHLSQTKSKEFGRDSKKNKNTPPPPQQGGG